jgi:small-conductance mechanosensitive channel
VSRSVGRPDAFSRFPAFSDDTRLGDTGIHHAWQETMNESFAVLLTALWHDMRQPDMLWQGGALILCLALAWQVSNWIRLPKVESSDVWRFGVGGLKRILFPLIALLLLLIARPLLGQWSHTHLLNLAIPLLGSMAVIRVLFYALRSALPPGGVLVAFERSIATLVWGVVALHIVGLLPDVVDFLEGIVFPVGRQKISLWLVLQAMFWAMLTLLVALWAAGAIEARLLRAESLHTSLRVVFARLSKALLVFVAVLVVLPLVGIDLTVLSVFGFGLQKIASNYVSGFIILLDRSIRIGDFVTIDQFYGQVMNITTRYVVLRSQDGREAIVPNETLITSTVISHTHSDRRLRLATQVQVSYDADVERALEILCQVAGRQSRVLADPPPVALVLRFADSGIDLEVGYWIDDPESGRANVQSALSLEVLREFRLNGIEIPFPHRDIRIVDATKAGLAGARPG